MSCATATALTPISRNQMRWEREPEPDAGSSGALFWRLRRAATAVEAARRERNMGGKERSPMHVGQQCPTDRNGGRQVFQRSMNEGERWTTTIS
jgi:hypothetical protein